MTITETRNEINTKIGEFKTILETRALSADEQKEFDTLRSSYEELANRVGTLEKCDDMEEEDTNDDEDKKEEDDDSEDELTEKNKKRSIDPPSRSKRALPAGARDYSNVNQYAHKKGYTVLRGLKQMYEGRSFSGIEGEVHNELCRSNPNLETKGLRIPCDLNGLNKEVREYKQKYEKRDLTTTTAAGATETIWDEDYYIEYLYNVMITPKIGCQFISNLHGYFQIPRMSANLTAQIVAEGTGATGSNETFDQIIFQPRSCIGNVNISRNQMLTSSFNSEKMVREDLMRSIGVAVDADCLVGNPVSNPASDYGVIFDPTVPSANILTLASSSHLPTWSSVVALAAAVEEQNVPFDETAHYVTSPYGKAVLADTAKSLVGQTSTYPTGLYQDGLVYNYSLVASNIVPNNFTYSGVTGHNMTALIFGVWRHLVVAEWGNSLDVILDPYTNAASGGVRVIGVLSFDHKLRHGGAVSFQTDLYTS